MGFSLSTLISPPVRIIPLMLRTHSSITDAHNLTNLKHCYETHLKNTSHTLKFSQFWGSCCSEYVCCSLQVCDAVKFWDWCQIPETITFTELFPMYLSNFLENSMQKGFEVFCMIIICKMHFPLDDIALNKSNLILLLSVSLCLSVVIYWLKHVVLSIFVLNTPDNVLCLTVHNICC